MDIDEQLASVGGVPDRISAVIPEQLYLGNKWEAQSAMLRQKHGITHVLSVCSEVADMNDRMLAAGPPQTLSPQTWDALPKPLHLIINVDDDENESLIPYFAQGNEFIANALKAGGRVYVHCALGISRSPTFIAAFLMKEKGKTRVSEALDYIREARPQILPNGAFLIQLELYERWVNPDGAAITGYPAWRTKMTKEIASYGKGHRGIWKFSDKVYAARVFPPPNDIVPSLNTLQITHLVAAGSSRALGVNLTKFVVDDFTNDVRRAASFVHDSVETGGTVMVYFRNESVLWYVVCGYFLCHKNMDTAETLSIMDRAEFTDLGTPAVIEQQQSEPGAERKDVPKEKSIYRRIRGFFL